MSIFLFWRDDTERIGALAIALQQSKEPGALQSKVGDGAVSVNLLGAVTLEDCHDLLLGQSLVELLTHSMGGE